jgi:type III secretion protein V
VLKYIVPLDHPTTKQMSTTLLPVVTPLAVEIDLGFLNDAGGQDRVIDSLAPAMRERLQQRYGVKVPGIRLRGNESDLPYGTYILMIHEVPLRSGTVKKSQRLYIGDRAKLDALSLSGSEHVKRFQGVTGFWIEEGDWERAAREGLELLEPLEVVIRDFEDLIAANLVEIVGHQEVQNLLESSELVGPDGDDIVSKEAHLHMDPLTNVVRALVSERVPITDFPRVYGLFRGLWTQHLPPWRITEAIRCDPAIRPLLWGNDSSFSHLKLGDRLMATIEAGIQGPHETVLALEPETTQQLLQAVREAVQGCERPALIVPRKSRRSVTRCLLELEFPQVPVLALAELEPGLGSRIQGTAELEPEAAEEDS